jgi:hypothetical protein
MLSENTIIEAVDNWLQREFGSGYFCGECTVLGGGRADLVYVQRGDVVHVVEAKTRTEQCPHAFRQLTRYPANYKWLALPEEEYERHGEGIASACSDNEHGLLLVAGGPHHRIVKLRRRAGYQSGRFDSEWNF